MTNFDPRIHHRRSIRLKGYDYSLEGAYFVTLVTRGRICLFGEIVDGEMHISELGKVILRALDELPGHFPNIGLVEYVVMPNHVHVIVMLDASGRGGSRQISKLLDVDQAFDRNITLGKNQTRPYSLSEIMRGFKSFSARRINLMRQSTGSAVWQRNYYERIIRNERELNAIYDYIVANPVQWSEDKENPETKALKAGRR